MFRARTTPAAGRGPSESISTAIRRVFAPHLAPKTGGTGVPGGPGEIGGDGARAEGGLGKLARRWRATLHRLAPLGHISVGNRARVVVDGDAAFEEMWAAIAAARERIVLDVYEFADDPIGRRTLSELVDAARRGCDVLVVVDDFGSFELPGGFFSELVAAGGRTRRWNPLLRFPFPSRVRDHRKLLVVDGRRAFCSGRNVTADYAGEGHGNGRFRDTTLVLEGPCASDLERVVVPDAPPPGDAPERGTPPTQDAASEEAPAGVLVQVLESNRPRARRGIQRALRVTLGRATSHAYLTSPYLIPPPRLLRSLVRASRRGVDVRILSAGRSDVPLARFASRHLLGRLLGAGVRVFELHERTLHAKTISVDGVWGAVGSFNLDPPSDRNLELTVAVLDGTVAGRLETDFLSDLEGAEELRFEDWRARSLGERLGHWLAYRLARLA